MMIVHMCDLKNFYVCILLSLFHNKSSLMMSKNFLHQKINFAMVYISQCNFYFKFNFQFKSL